MVSMDEVQLYNPIYYYYILKKKDMACSKTCLFNKNYLRAGKLILYSLSKCS